MTKSSTAFKIVPGVPIPRPQTGTKNLSVVGQLRRMAVGDSVYMEGKYSTVWQRGAHAFGGGNFAVRKEGEGWRLWRTGGGQ